jgi:hypothetical protein
MSWSLALVYESGRRYILPMEILEKFIDKQTLDKIKKEALKEIAKNG